jgi:hypothetical protein
MNGSAKSPSSLKADAIRLQIKSGLSTKQVVVESNTTAVQDLLLKGDTNDIVTHEDVATNLVTAQISSSPPARRRGRPRKYDQVKPTDTPKDRVTFTLAVSRDDYKKLSIVAGKKQVETGESYSAQKLVKETLGHALSVKFL